MSAKNDLVNFLFKEKGWKLMPTNNKQPSLFEWKEDKFDSKSAFEKTLLSNTYAVLTGKRSGITVIDIDKAKKENEYDGIELFKQFTNKINIGTHPPWIVKTPSGGYHLYYKYNSEIKNLAKLYSSEEKKIIPWDVRNDGAYVVGCLSATDKGKYETKKELADYLAKYRDFPELPDSFIRLFKDGHNKRSQYVLDVKSMEIIENKNYITVTPVPAQEVKSDGKKELKDNKREEESNISVDRMREVVNNLSVERSTNRDSWIRVLWAIVNVGTKSNRNFTEIIHEFSKKTTADNYDEFDVNAEISRAMQRTTKKEHKEIEKELKGYGWGSLLLWAKQDNPNFKQPLSELVFTDAAKIRHFCLDNKNSEGQMIDYLAGCVAFYEQCARSIWYIRQLCDDNIYRWNRAENENRYPFDKTYKTHLTYTNKFGNEKIITLDEIVDKCMSQRDFINHVCYDMIRYFPTNNIQDIVKLYPGKKVLNIFPGFKIQQKKQKLSDINMNLIQEFFFHMKAKLCDNHEEAYRYLLAWIAQLLQKPLEKIGIGILFTGPQGTGKNIFFEGLFRGIYNGEDISMVALLSELTQKFNDHLCNKAITIVAEADDHSTDKRTSASILKSKVTEKKQIKHTKNKSAETVDDFSRIVVFSNSSVPIKLDVTDRRWLCISTGKKEDEAYYKCLADAFENKEKLQEFFDFFMCQDISNVNFRTLPITKTKENIISHNLPPIVRFFKDIANYNPETWKLFREDLNRDDKKEDYPAQLLIHVNALNTAYGKYARYSSGSSPDIFETELKNMEIPLVPNKSINSVKRKAVHVTITDLRAIINKHLGIKQEFETVEKEIIEEKKDEKSDF